MQKSFWTIWCQHPVNLIINCHFYYADNLNDRKSWMIGPDEVTVFVPKLVYWSWAVNYHLYHLWKRRQCLLYYLVTTSSPVEEETLHVILPRDDVFTCERGDTACLLPRYDVFTCRRGGTACYITSWRSLHLWKRRHCLLYYLVTTSSPVEEETLLVILPRDAIFTWRREDTACYMTS